MNFKSGTKYKAETPSGQKYSAFLPELINKEFTWKDPQIDLLLEQARGWIGELNAYSKLVPNVEYFIQSHVAKEAEQSSRIEGTKTTLEELYLDIADLTDSEKVNDQEEVKNYIKALNESVKELTSESGLPLCTRLVCDTHKILLSGVRGYSRNPGKIRKIQNKIGGGHGTFEDAVFIPPSPDKVEDLLKDLENFWNNSDLHIPNLIKTALSHYQFETIHPFEDGNGRTGRLIIILQLISYKMLEKPTLYLSDYFEKNRPAYYDALSRVRESHDIEHWIKFFLIGVADTAKKGKETLEKIIDLRIKYETLISGGIGVKRQKLARELIVALFEKPVVTAKDVESILNITKPTAHSLVDDLERVGILKEKTGLSRNRIFTLHEYLALFNN
jgi:Fic family protein